MGTEEQDIFDSANEADDEREEGQQPETREEEAPEKEQAARQPPEGEKPPEKAADGAAPQTDKTEPPPQPHQVPLTELLNTRERAQAAERERDQLRQRLEAFERERKAAEEKPRETPDMFADPEGFAKTIFSTLEERIAAERQERDVSETRREFARLQKEHGETFTTAWTEFVKAAESAPALRQAFDNLPAWQRGEEVLGWYRKQTALREIGDDPAAYRQKVQDELLKDDAFVAKVIEKVRGAAGGSSNGSGSRNVTRFPSLNRQTSAAPAHEADDDDSEEAIWEAGTAARR